MNTRPGIRALEAFHAVVTLGSVSAAAERLHVTQPAISHLLKSLDTATGLKLFRKQGRRLELTGDGRLYFEEVENALLVFSRLQGSVDVIKGAKTGHLRIVAMPVVADHLLPRLLGRFMQINPDIEVTLEVAELYRALPMLETGAVELALVSPVQGHNLKEHASFPGKGVLIAPKGWRGAGKKQVNLASIQDEPFVALSQDSPFRYLLDQHLSAENLKLSIKVQTRTQSAIAGFVAANAGVAIVDRIVAEDLAGDLQILTFEPELTWRFQLLSRHIELSSVATLLVNFLAKEFERLREP